MYYLEYMKDRNTPKSNLVTFICLLISHNIHLILLCIAYMTPQMTL